MKIITIVIYSILHITAHTVFTWCCHWEQLKSFADYIAFSEGVRCNGRNWSHIAKEKCQSCHETHVKRLNLYKQNSIRGGICTISLPKITEPLPNRDEKAIPVRDRNAHN